MATNFKRTCPECGQSFVTAHGRKFFCSTPCQKAWGNRDLSEGQALVGLAKAWRLGRNTRDPEMRELAKLAFATFCRRLDESNSADLAAGRTGALKMLRKRTIHGLVDLA